jgi:hypothetical protein
MSRVWIVVALALSGSVACKKKPVVETAPVPSTTVVEAAPVVTAEPTVEPTATVAAKKPDAGAALTVEDDFVDEAVKDITSASMETELTKLEKEIGP